MASVLELPPINAHDGSESSPIRTFQLTLNDVTIELSSLGATVTKVLLPNYSQDSPTADAASGETLPRDDVVLSYASPTDQHNDNNKPFFGSIVGRVANRIKDGRFLLLQTEQSPETYQLDKNDGPNHLHGGINGFHKNIWAADVVNDRVKFSLISPDGDQDGYPGGIQVTATYSLKSIKSGAKLCLNMQASLLTGETKASPIALAQHSYFNLASHSSSKGILGHTLRLPNCTKFTPLDNTSIPTRDVQRVDDSGTKAMDFRKEKVLADALIQYGEERAGLDHRDAVHNVHRILNTDATNIAKTAKNGGAPGANLDGDSPYGFDHNYIINMDGRPSLENDMPRLAAVLSHPPTNRMLRVSTTAPGIQLYTANYLDGTTPPPALCKDGTRYYQWQGICLETQTYPDSIFPGVDVDGDEEFAKGRCFILRPGGSDYFHDVEYEFSKIRED
ncbi:hypothetical protein ACHAXR_008880 [Thalassiosira sp. AJA248-18]